MGSLQDRFGNPFGIVTQEMTHSTVYLGFSLWGGGGGWGRKEISASKTPRGALYLVGAQQMPVLFSLSLSLKGGGNLFICEPQKHLHDLKMNVPSPGVACTIAHCVFKELWAITSGAKFGADRVCSPHGAPLPTAKQAWGSPPAPGPRPLAPALRNSPSDSSTSLSFGCPLIINALMPLHYIVGFENLKYG